MERKFLDHVEAGVRLETLADQAKDAEAKLHAMIFVAHHDLRMSFRHIAQLTGISHATVARIYKRTNEEVDKAS